MLEDRINYRLLSNDPRYNVPVEIEMIEFNKDEEDFVFLFNDTINYNELYKTSKNDANNFINLLIIELKNILNINKWNK